MKKLLLTITITLLYTLGYSQNVGIGTNTPDLSAKLEVSSNNSGFLPPRMTTTERNGIINPAVGLMIYNTTSDCLEVFGKGKWNSIYCVPIDSNTLVTDIDGHTYPTVKICDQTWMSKNLDVARYRNGDPIPQVSNPSDWANLTTGAWCWYNNDSDTYASVYGRLYNWFAVNDPRGLAPTGWHVPSIYEWSILPSCLGGDAVSGGKMKEEGTIHWNSPNVGATNISGFTGLAAGFRNLDGNFGHIGHIGVWWSTTEGSINTAWNPSLWSDFADFIKDPNGSKNCGYTIRCLKDTPITTLNDGLVGYWPFNGNANDESGNGNNGTVSGAILINDRNGNPNSAYSFNGSSRIEVSPFNYLIGNNPFSVSFWTYPIGGGWMIACGQLNNGQGFDAGDNNAGSTNFHTHIYKFDHTSSLTPISLNTWTHLTIIFTGTRMKVYKNSVLSMDDPVDYVAANLQPGILRFGQQLIFNEYFNGQLDDIRIYNRVLSDSEVQYLYSH